MFTEGFGHGLEINYRREIIIEVYVISTMV